MDNKSERLGLSQDYRCSRKWKRKRKVLFKNRGKKCECCGSVKDIEVHHITYDRFGGERLEDLKILCRECHREIHGFNKNKLTFEFCEYILRKYFGVKTCASTWIEMAYDITLEIGGHGVRYLSTPDARVCSRALLIGYK